MAEGRRNEASRLGASADRVEPNGGRERTRFFETSYSSESQTEKRSRSAASRWMEKEKKLEEEMERDYDKSNKGGNGAAAATDHDHDHDHDDDDDFGTKELGRWEYLHGNHVLRPTGDGDDAQPRALLHFLGGALVGAAPQLAYRYLLERLSSRGYLVVATPYHLSFDHLKTCDEVIGRFERVAPALAKEYGAVPVVGLGHSCGSLLHVLITSLFPDTPRAANALMSYNNRQVGEAVPFFEEVFVPLFGDRERNGSELMKAMIGMAGEQFRGRVPSDESIQRLVKSLPPPLPGLPKPSSLLQLDNNPSLLTVPTPLRQSLTNFLAEPTFDALSDVAGTGLDVPSLLLTALDISEQIPQLIDEVEGGARDFVPPPDAASSAARRAYRCRRTLLLQFENDNLDDSELLEGYLREAEGVMRTKRPMVAVDLRRRVMEGGNHLTPLLGHGLGGGEGWGEMLESALGGILGVTKSNDGGDGGDGGAKAVRERLGYEQVEKVVDELVAWLDQGSL